MCEKHTASKFERACTGIGPKKRKVVEDCKKGVCLATGEAELRETEEAKKNIEKRRKHTKKTSLDIAAHSGAMTELYGLQNVCC